MLYMYSSIRALEARTLFLLSWPFFVLFFRQVSGDGRVTVRDSRDGTVPYDLPLKVQMMIGLLFRPRLDVIDSYSIPQAKPLTKIDAISGEDVAVTRCVLGFRTCCLTPRRE